MKIIVALNFKNPFIVGIILIRGVAFAIVGPLRLVLVIANCYLVSAFIINLASYIFRFAPFEILSSSQISLKILPHFEECNSIAFSYFTRLGAVVDLLGVLVEALCSLKAFIRGLFDHLTLIDEHPINLLFHNCLPKVWHAEVSFT